MLHGRMGPYTTSNGKIPCEEWKVDFGISDNVASCSQGGNFCSNRQFIIANHVVQHMPVWPKRTVSWYPPTKYFDTKPGRKRGRPAQRWDDHPTQFAAQDFGDEYLLSNARHDSSWNMKEGLLVTFWPQPFE